MGESVFSNAIYLDDVPQEQWKNYIGNGYRSVAYLTDHEKKGQIVLFGFDKAGNRKTFIAPWKSHIHYRVKYDTGRRDIYDNFIETRWFNSSFERKKRLDEIGKSLFIVECLKPEQEFLQEMFYKDALEPDFNKQDLRIQFIDIETEISEVFEKPNDARNRINMITIYDSQTEKYYTWSLEHAEIDFKEEPLCKYPKSKFVFYEFNNNEEKLLEHFLDWVESNYPDVSMGWNTKAYDWPYIVRRIENVLGKNAAARLSPVGRYRIKEINHDNERADVGAEIEVDIAGLFIADGLVLYRDKFHLAGGPLDGGHGLSNVGEHEGLGKKIQYEGTLKDLYIKDYQKFYEYNVRDVDLVVKIEEKCKMIALSRMVAGSGLCNYDTIYSSISYLIGSVTQYARLFMNRTFQSYLNEKKEREAYEGAYVFEPIPGVYDGGIACVDFNSLYPSSIRVMNLSPETYVGKLSLIDNFDKLGAGWRIAFNSEPPIDLNDPAVEELWFYPNGDAKRRKKVKKAEIMKLLETKCIFTRNNTLFLKHSVKQGVVSGWCKHFYNLRKSTKNKMQALDLALYNNEIPEDKIAETKVEIQNLDAKQMAYKLAINSIYGILGTNHSPLYIVELAQTVTRLGKFCNISASKFIAKTFKERYGAPDNYITAVSGDTDSQFVNISCMAKHLLDKGIGNGSDLSKWSDDDKLKLWKFVDGFVENEVNPYVQNLVKDYCYTEHPEVLRYSLEYVSSGGIYEAKKHYATRKIIAEGPELVDKIKWSGIELKKASVPAKVKNVLKDIYEGILLHEWSEKNFIEYVNDVWSDFKKMTIDEISFWKGYSSAREAIGFLQMQKGSTAVASASTYYNQIINKLGLGKKYDQILLGQKVRFCYVKPTNAYRISYIAFPDGQWPKEFDKIFEIDYEVMFEKLITGSLKGFFSATKFSKVDPSKQVAFDIFEL